MKKKIYIYIRKINNFLFFCEIIFFDYGTFMGGIYSYETVLKDKEKIGRERKCVGVYDATDITI